VVSQDESGGSIAELDLRGYTPAPTFIHVSEG
jgi:hypothetical protein